MKGAFLRDEFAKRNDALSSPLIFSTCMRAKAVYGHLNGAWPVSFLDL